MSPPTRSNNPPRFSEDLNDSQFEDFCSDLFEREPGITNCSRYGFRGQKQHGIDLLADKAHGQKEVAQCKCHREFDKTKLKKAADEFLNSMDHWRDWKISRFVLIVACSVQDTNVQNEKEVQRKKFSGIGIEFDLWGDEDLAKKLRPHSDIVEIHLGPLWVRKLCGPNFATKMVSRAVCEAAARGPVGDLLLECAEADRSEVGLKFAGIRDTARSGRMQSALDQIEKYRSSPQWALLDVRSQGRGLRLAASLHLDCLEDVQRAEELLFEAKRLAPGENYQVIDSAIAYKHHGKEAALEAVISPLNLDAWNMKLAVLIDLGRFDQVLAGIQSPLFSPNANTWLIASIGALAQHDFSAAREHAMRALKESPNWFIVRLHAAKINYLEALLPHFPQQGHLPWPLPPNREYLRGDSTSLESLDRAANMFRELLDVMDQNYSERVFIEGWLLGCLANHPARRQEATQYARKLFESNPAHLPAAVWAMEKGFEIDSKMVSAALTRRDGKLVGHDELQASCVMTIQTATPAEALVLMDTGYAEFEKLNALFFWRFLKAQIAEDAGESELVSRLIEEEPDEANRAKITLAVMKVRFHKTGKIDNLCQQLLGAFEQDASPRNLFAAFEILVQADRGSEAIQWTDELLRLYPTLVGITLALQANFDAGQFRKCLEILESHKTCYSGQPPPARVVRLEIECLRQIGCISEANALAEHLVKNEESTSSLITLFQTQVTLADLKGCVITVRTLLRRSDVPVMGLLQMAKAIQVEDITLAKECWKEADSRGIQGGAEIVEAVGLAFRLGLDENAEPLIPKICALAINAPGIVQGGSLDEIIERNREQSEQCAHAKRIFNEGQIAAHSLARKINAPLATILTENMRKAAKSGCLHELIPALIRPGTKTRVWDSVPLNSGALFMDVTALYVAEEIGILDMIEKRCAPLFISPNLPKLIQVEIHGVTPHQPALHEARVDVLRLFNHADLKILEQDRSLDEFDHFQKTKEEAWRSLLSNATKSGGVFCDSIPPIDESGMSVLLEEQEAEGMVSCGDLVRTLQRLGELSSEQASEICKKLGNAGMAFTSRIDLNFGVLVLLSMSMAEELARVKMLESVAQVFNVRVTQQTIDHLQSEVEAHEHQIEMAAKLSQIAYRLSNGITVGTYKTLARLAGNDNHAERVGPCSLQRCLLDLTTAGDSGIAVVLVDDRFLLRFNKIGKARSAGISDVLKTLCKDGSLTPGQYHQKLLRLRERNARYLPFESDEVWEHISAAPVKEGKVYETKALTVLRRYLASCFSDWGRFCLTVKTDKGVEIGEYVWVIDALQTVMDSMARLWTTESLSEHERRAKADWLLHNLYAPVHGIIEATTREPALGGDITGQASSILLLMTSGVQFLSSMKRQSEELNHPLAQFYQWIADRLIYPCLQTEPGIASVIAEETKRLIFRRSGFTGTKIFRKIPPILAQRVYLDLPQVIQEAMDLDARTLKWLGLTLSSSWNVTACGRRFPARVFWKSLVRALKGETTRLKSSDTNQDFEIGPASDKKNALSWFRFSGPGIRAKHHLHSDCLRLLCGTRQNQRNFLETRPYWLDRKVEERGSLITRIVAPNDPARRIELLGDAKNASAAWYYKKLRDKVNSKHAVITSDCLPPSAEILCAHLRLDIQEMADRSALVNACERLCSDVGLAETIERLGSLPVLFPESLVFATCQLGDNEFKALIARLQRRLRNPVARLHLFHLIAARSITDEAWLAEAQSLRDELFSVQAARQSWKAFRRILDWVKVQMQWIHSYRELPSASKLVLVWLHSGRLFNSLTLGGADSDCLLRAFEVWSLAHGIRIENHELEFYFDAMHPRFAGRVPVMIRGFGAILGTLPSQHADKLKLNQVPWSARKDRTGSSVGMLLRDHSALSNQHGSYLGGDAKERMLCGISPESVEKIFPDNPSELIAVSIRELEKAVELIPPWDILAYTLTDAPCQDDLTERVNVLLTRALEKKVIQNEVNGRLLAFATSRAPIGISDTLRQKLEDAVWERLFFCREKKRKEGGNDGVEQDLHLVLNCFAGLAIVLGNEKATQQNLHRFLARVVRAWPKAASRMMVVGRWPASLPIVSQSAYWESAMAIRASRDPVR